MRLVFHSRRWICQVPSANEIMGIKAGKQLKVSFNTIPAYVFICTIPRMISPGPCFPPVRTTCAGASTTEIHLGSSTIWRELWKRVCCRRHLVQSGSSRGVSRGVWERRACAHEEAADQRTAERIGRMGNGLLAGCGGGREVRESWGGRERRRERENGRSEDRATSSDSDCQSTNCHLLFPTSLACPLCYDNVLPGNTSRRYYPRRARGQVCCLLRARFVPRIVLSMYGGSMPMLTAGLQRIRSSAHNGSLNTSARTR